MLVHILASRPKAFNSVIRCCTCVNLLVASFCRHIADFVIEMGMREWFICRKFDKVTCRCNHGISHMTIVYNDFLKPLTTLFTKNVPDLYIKELDIKTPADKDPTVLVSRQV